ncbi:WXG100 family type VII secretion target [Amycolatopsis sp. EV170708-02-1]|uniref:WXG100 family type VII secretion target n=1 Tax=Amycolatopsis sp. EV170708-02-1 TaxID=2919322 RepID=UPI001F0C0EA1|nr:WXG100 family type VII secretion target [Amycolatopsis sp. EV170708-02-1]UMP06958.1 WXG100 family type VII secretion target [Amycolatopsis sp. EV170708-02-1]
MVEFSADPAPPPLPDPALEQLNLDQLAQLVNEVNPDVFYQRAQVFDAAAARLQEVRDAFRREARQLQEAWTGKIEESFENVAQETSGAITNVLHSMQDPGYGTRLRQVGDALAMGQQRLKDLQAQKAQQAAAPLVTGAPPADVVEKGNQQTALRIVHDLCTAYRDIGTGIAPLPETTPAPGGKANAGNGPGTAGAGGDPITVVHNDVTPPAEGSVNGLPLGGSLAMGLAPRGEADVSLSGTPEGAQPILPFAVGAAGVLGGASSGSGGGAGGSAHGGSSSKHADVVQAFQLSPGGGGYVGDSVIGRAKPADAGQDEAIPVMPGMFMGAAGEDRSVPGRRAPGSAVSGAASDEVVEGVLGRRQSVTDLDGGLVGWGLPAGTSAAARRREDRKAPGTEERPVTVSEGEEGAAEKEKKEARPATVADPVVVARFESEPVANAQATSGGSPALPSVAQFVTAERAPQGLDAAAGGGAPQNVLPVRALAAEGASALPGALPVNASASTPASGSAPLEGGPMGPMMGMGGMGGQPEENKERSSEIVPGPDPAVWDYSHGTPSAIGKPERASAESAPDESPDEIVARILERRS